MPLSYLRTSSLGVQSPSDTRKRKAGRSDSIRSIGFAEDHQFNVRWLKEASRILKPDGTIWVTGTHHIIFSLGFALQTMRFKIINVIRSKYKTPCCELQDLRRGERCSASRIGECLGEHDAVFSFARYYAA